MISAPKSNLYSSINIYFFYKDFIYGGLRCHWKRSIKGMLSSHSSRKVVLFTNLRGWVNKAFGVKFCFEKLS